MGKLRMKPYFVVLSVSVIVLNCCPSTVLHKYRNVYCYTAGSVICWAYQLATALDYIHDREMLHCSIKPSK